MPKCDGVDGKSKVFENEYDSSYTGEFGALLQGYNGRFGDARGFEISESVGYNRFHIQDWWPDAMPNPCYPDSSEVGNLERRYQRIETPDTNTNIKTQEPDYEDVDSDGSYASATFSVTYSPVPFLSVGVSTSASHDFLGGSSVNFEDYKYSEWDLEGGTIETDQTGTDGVRFDIQNDVKSSGDGINVNLEAQNDYSYVCGRQILYESTPLLTWDAFINVVE